MKHIVIENPILKSPYEEPFNYWSFFTGGMATHSPGAQAVPYMVVDTERSERSEVHLLIPPCSPLVFLPPLYNQPSNE